MSFCDFIYIIKKRVNMAFYIYINICFGTFFVIFFVYILKRERGNFFFDYIYYI